MPFDDLLRIWRFEYYATMAALEPGTPWPTFYDWLIATRRTSRFVLSAHGIGRDIEA